MVRLKGLNVDIEVNFLLTSLSDLKSKRARCDFILYSRLFESEHFWRRPVESPLHHANWFRQLSGLNAGDTSAFRSRLITQILNSVDRDMLGRMNQFHFSLFTVKQKKIFDTNCTSFVHKSLNFRKTLPGVVRTSLEFPGNKFTQTNQRSTQEGKNILNNYLQVIERKEN